MTSLCDISDQTYTRDMLYADVSLGIDDGASSIADSLSAINRKGQTASLTNPPVLVHLSSRPGRHLIIRWYILDHTSDKNLQMSLTA